jgi:Rps23 Pro-64 3,4-dihydroxylase Tpa1-like proline 4-hydroxylase
MRKLLVVSAMLHTLSLNLTAQDDGVKLDLLKAPASPASNLLGIAPSDVDKPTDASAFMLSLQKASSNFTALPSNYAFDISPYWLSKNKAGDNTIESFKKSTGGYALIQTLVLSFAFRNTDEDETDLMPNTVYAGVGFKLSLARGRFDDNTNTKLTQIQNLQGEANDQANKSLDNYLLKPEVMLIKKRQKEIETEKAILEEKIMAEVIAAKKEALKGKIDLLEAERLDIENNLRNTLLEELKKTEKAEIKQKIKQLASEFQVTRVGWTLDLAGGFSGAFLDKRFDNSRAHNAGVWFTGGYTDDDKAGETYFGSLLGLARLMYNPDKIFALDNATNKQSDIWTFDFGGRYIYARPQSKFSASVEGIYRSVLSSQTIKPSWRFVANADYALWANQKLTFSFGRQFDGTITKDGNLIAALSFLTGFGNKR